MDENRVIKIIRRVMPAVVSIGIAKSVEDLEKEIPAGLMGAITLHATGKKAKLWREAAKREVAMLREMADAHGMVEVGGGSGCIVHASGLILTNKHVVSDGLAAYSVILNDGRRFAAEILSRDPVNDVAILKIDTASANRGRENLPSLELGDATRLALGQSVIAIGNALGMFKNTVSLGIVSGLSRAITAQADPMAPPQELRGLIQTDAAINPGNSGGPLVDRDGRVVGINAAIISGAQSIGFAIPVNAARRDIDDIKKYGRIRRPLLGLRYVVDEAER
jgi:S1-C subfamily serine protease